MAIVMFPDGTRVRASSISDRCVHDSDRTFGLYLDARWEPSWPASVIDWEDFGLPENPELAAQQIVGGVQPRPKRRAGRGRVLGRERSHRNRAGVHGRPRTPAAGGGNRLGPHYLSPGSRRDHRPGGVGAVVCRMAGRRPCSEWSIGSAPVDEQVVPVLRVEDASRAVAWYERLDIHAVSIEFGVPLEEEGLARRECDLSDPDGNRLRIATPRG
jgi:hypothetical protein